ncbi:unnamed protein product [Urochloa decumbens]|uniref:Plant-specific domain TIGR01615 family protein n=1 Tax=Urochloa decumbens TaxID=240449 RepID=A0ABC8Z6C8_9POAL
MPSAQNPGRCLTWIRAVPVVQPTSQALLARPQSPHPQLVGPSPVCTAANHCPFATSPTPPAIYELLLPRIDQNRRAPLRTKSKEKPLSVGQPQKKPNHNTQLFQQAMVMEEAMDGEMSLSNMVLGFFEDFERERRPENDDDEDSGAGDSAESKAFWQTQRSQLHEALSKTSPAESRIRADTEAAIKSMRAAAAAASCCSCTGRPAAGGECRRCMLRHVAERLRDAGYNSALCTSKWTRSPDIPSGEHSYVDVVVQTRSGKAVRVVVELSFRAEFEVARAGAEYRALVAALPEVFVGRADRLRGVVKAMCAAAKQCMKENNMHMGPWRKHKYMQAKWLGTPERTAAEAAAPVVVVPAVTVGSPEKQTKFRASMLTFDFGRTAVEVV